MQEKTRQDRQLEARAEQLDKSAKLLNSMIAAILVVLVVLVTLLIVLYLKRKKPTEAVILNRCSCPCVNGKNSMTDK